MGTMPTAAELKEKLDTATHVFSVLNKITIVDVGFWPGGPLEFFSEHEIATCCHCNSTLCATKRMQTRLDAVCSRHGLTKAIMCFDCHSSRYGGGYTDNDIPQWVRLHH